MNWRIRDDKDYIKNIENPFWHKMGRNLLVIAYMASLYYFTRAFINELF